MTTKWYSEEERNEIIAYGQERGRVILISLLIALILGSLFGIMAQSIIFLLTFCPLRRYAGGYHASTQERCYVISFVAIVVTFLIIKEAQYNINADILLSVFNLIIILLLAPVENDNRQLDEDERKRYGNKTKLIAVFIFLLNFFFRWKGYFYFIIPILAAYSLVSISLILGYIKFKRIKIL
ncbi:MAG: accessory gene regulator B family protein [Lachnospiraceae bacterium]|nr:accessory gene regulator B family protein [Lachnospiraceae bacterium]